MNYNTNIDKKIIDGKVFDTNIDKWVDANEYLYHHCIKITKQQQAEELQKKIAEDLYLYETKEFNKWLENLAETNGVTNY